MKKFEKGQYVVTVADYQGRPSQIVYGLHKVESQVGRNVELVCVAPVHMRDEKYRVSAEKLLLVTNSCLVESLEREFISKRHTEERIMAIDDALKNLFRRARNSIAVCDFIKQSGDKLIKEDVIGYPMILREVEKDANELLQVIGACNGLPYINNDLLRYRTDEIYEVTERIIRETRV